MHSNVQLAAPSMAASYQQNFRAQDYPMPSYGYAQTPIPSPYVNQSNVANLNHNPAPQQRMGQQHWIQRPTIGAIPADSLSALLSQLTQSMINVNQNASASSQESSGSAISKLRIPRLDVEEFRGDILKYQNFKKTFNIMVDRAQLDPIDQFLLLKSRVKDSAANELPREVSNSSLAEAWKNLDNRYSNQRKVVEATIMDFMSAYEQGTPSTEVLLRQVQAHQRAVFNLKEMKLGAMDVLRCLAIAKMDKITSQRFNDFLGDGAKFPTEEDFQKFFEKEHTIQQTVDNRLRESHQRDGRQSVQRQHASSNNR